MNDASELGTFLTSALVDPGHQAVYLSLEERARAARGVDELAFTITNETWRLFKYRQAVLWTVDGSTRPRLRTVSGLAALAEDSPFTVWLKSLGRVLSGRITSEPEFIGFDDLPADLAEGWREWMPDYLIAYPVTDPRDERRHAIVAFALDEAPDEAQQEWALRLMHTYGHAWSGLVAGRRRRASMWRRAAAWVLPLLLLAAMFIPVQLSVLAPAEVIGLDALSVASPMDGVIKEFHVQPNETVKRGQVLFTLDDTTLRNRREVAAKQLAVARADALAAQQKAFDNEQSRAEVAALSGRVAERQAELLYVEELMRRIDVRADRDGVAVFGDINDWQGKPVVTGERVVLLADPQQVGMLIWLPVADAINLEPGAAARLFLQVAPLSPLPGKLIQSSYQSTLSPEGVASYRLKAAFDPLADGDHPLARIGLKGTAKIYGARAPLGYYLFRRPLSAMREWAGF